jgi:phage terminase large subunit-like protein
MQVEIAGIQLTVKPDSSLSEVVALWETEFENRKMKN